jgi:hypothetical protein
MAKPDPAPSDYLNGLIKAFGDLWGDTVPWREEVQPSGADFIFTPPDQPELQVGAGPGCFVLFVGSASFEGDLPDLKAADWVMAICDSVAAGRICEKIKTNWIFEKRITIFELKTRGIVQTVTHSAYGFALGKASRASNHFAPWPTRGTA